MSQSERSSRVPSPQTNQRPVERDNAQATLRPLAPRILPQVRPIAVRGKAEASIRSSRNSENFRPRGKHGVRCNLCFSRSCSLISHKLYEKSSTLRQHSTYRPPQTQTSDLVFKSSYAIRLLALSDTPQTALLGVALPADLDVSLMQNVFCDWFTVYAPRHLTIPRPREIVKDLLHGPFLAPATSDPVLCLSILTVSAASQKSLVASTNNVLALTLLDRAMGELRGRMTSNRSPVTDTTISAAIYIWAANLYLADDTSLRQHANGVRSLIDARGGLSSLGMADTVANLFTWVDIMNSLRLNQPCQYADDRRLEAPDAAGFQYGSYWEKLEGEEEEEEPDVADRAVVTACRNCCRAIELLDRVEHDKIEAGTYWYLHQRIPQLYQENSKTRAKYVGTRTTEECVVLAIDIVKLMAFNGGQSRPGRRSLKLQATLLVEAIKGTGAADFWQDRFELLIWLLITACLAEPKPEHRPWCARVLRGSLQHNFGAREVWPDDWVSQLQRLLLSFVWSAKPPFDRVEAMCQQYLS